MEEDRENRPPEGREVKKEKKEEDIKEEDEEEIEMNLRQQSLLSLLGLMMDQSSPSTPFDFFNENEEEGRDE